MDKETENVEKEKKDAVPTQQPNDEGRQGESDQGKGDKEVQEWLGIAKSIADKVPDKFFPAGLTDKVTPEQAGGISLGIGILAEIIWFCFVSSRGMAVFDFLVCFAGIYMALYAAKKGSLDKGNTILFAGIAFVLCIETIFYGIYCWQALGVVDALRNAAESFSF